MQNQPAEFQQKGFAQKNLLLGLVMVSARKGPVSDHELNLFSAVDLEVKEFSHLAQQLRTSELAPFVNPEWQSAILRLANCRDFNLVAEHYLLSSPLDLFVDLSYDLEKAAAGMSLNFVSTCTKDSVQTLWRLSRAIHVTRPFRSSTRAPHTRFDQRSEHLAVVFVVLLRDSLKNADRDTIKELLALSADLKSLSSVNKVRFLALDAEAMVAITVKDRLAIISGVDSETAQSAAAFLQFFEPQLKFSFKLMAYIIWKVAF